MSQRGLRVGARERALDRVGARGLFVAGARVGERLRVGARERALDRVGARGLFVAGGRERERPRYVRYGRYRMIVRWFWT